MAVINSHCLIPVCTIECLAPLQVRTATTAEPVAHAILELEALLRPAVFASSWGSQAQPRPAGAPARKGPPGRKPTPKPGKALAVGASKSGRLNRAASTASGKPVVSLKPYNTLGTVSRSHLFRMLSPVVKKHLLSSFIW